MTLQIIASVALTAAVVCMIIATIWTIKGNVFLSSVYNAIGSSLVVVVVVLNYFMK